MCGCRISFNACSHNRSRLPSPVFASSMILLAIACLTEYSKTAPHTGEPGRFQMPKYLVLLNLTDQGAKTVKEIPNKRDQSRETAKKFGVERKQAWMTFGPYDFVHLYEAPSGDAMAKFVLKFGSFGSVRTTVMRAWDESEHLPLVQDLP